MTSVEPVDFSHRVRAYERAARAPWAALLVLFRLWEPTVRFAGRDAARDTRGLLLGAAWTVVAPVLMLLIYGFVFGVVLGRGARFDTGAGEGPPFALAFFAGLVVFQFFAQTVAGASGVVAARGELARKASFPLDILPWAHVGANLARWVPPLLVLLIAAVLAHPQGLGPHAFLTPVVLAPLVLLGAGLVFALAALGVFLRDLGQILPPLMTATLFLSPVFYPIDRAPEAARPFLRANPIAPTVEGLRAVLLEARAPDWAHLGWQAGAGGLALWAGYWFFAKTRKAFADVM